MYTVCERRMKELIDDKPLQLCYEKKYVVFHFIYSSVD